MKKLKITISLMGIILLLGIVGSFSSEAYNQVKSDLEKLETEEYDTVLFSMYPTDYYQAEDYAIFRAMDIVRTDYVLTNGTMLKIYMNEMKKSGNNVSTVYLGIRPEKISTDAIAKIVQENPEIMFEITLAHPYIDFWTEKTEKETEKILEKYKKSAETLLMLSNARVYFFGAQEWLVCNSKNYEETFQTNPEVSKFLLANTDTFHTYMLSTMNIEKQFEDMSDLIIQQRVNPIQYPDGSNMDIVFLGDSIIGNHTDSLSIPEVVSSLTGARVYNCGYGGRSAALGKNDKLSVSMIVDGLLNGNLSDFPTDEQVYLGSKEFVNRENKERELMFVVHYGFNDYTNGYPVVSEDKFDVYSYSGALRVAIQNLKNTFPDATILLIVPGFITHFEYGEQVFAQGSKLEDYREAVRELAWEMGVEYLDAFQEMPTNKDNWSLYLDDGIHFSERGRFMMGRYIALRIP